MKKAGTAASFKQVWSFPWKMQGNWGILSASFLTRILHHSPNDVIATFLDLANLPSAEGPEQVEKAVPCNIIFPKLKYP